MSPLTRICVLFVMTSAAHIQAQQSNEIPKAESPGFGVGLRDTIQDGEYLTITQRLNPTLRVPPIEFPPENRFSRASLGTVSVDELRHPLSRSAQHQLERIQRDLKKGDRIAAIQKLTELQDDESAKTVVVGMLGAEYLAIGRVDEAITFLETAVHIQPSVAGNHSNLGYALCVIGQCDKGEAEVRAALLYDENCRQAHYLMGVILLTRGDPRALNHLRFAEKDIPAAHMAQALYYAQHHNMDLANEQLLEYLGPQGKANLPVAQNWLRNAMERAD